jgi:hypothetical protein
MPLCLHARHISLLKPLPEVYFDIETSRQDLFLLSPSPSVEGALEDVLHHIAPTMPTGHAKTNTCVESLAGCETGTDIVGVKVVARYWEDLLMPHVQLNRQYMR